MAAEGNDHHDIHNDHDIHDDHDEHEEDPIAPCRLSRSRYTTQFYGQLVNAVMLNELDEPANWKQAMEGPESEKWLEAMRFEIDSMYVNQKWTLVDIPRTERSSRINGYLRKRLTQTETYLSIRLGLSQKVSDKFKELTTKRLSLP